MQTLNKSEEKYQNEIEVNSLLFKLRHSYILSKQLKSKESLEKCKYDKSTIIQLSDSDESDSVYKTQEKVSYFDSEPSLSVGVDLSFNNTEEYPDHQSQMEEPDIEERKFQLSHEKLN